MNSQTLATGYLHLALMVFAVLAVHYAYRAVLVARFRMWIFILRDQVFDHCAAAGLPTKHPDYAWTRAEFNRYIRAPHVINSGRLFPLLFVRRGGGTVQWPSDPFVSRKLFEARFRLALFLCLAAPLFCFTTIVIATVRSASARRATDPEEAASIAAWADESGMKFAHAS